MAETSDELVDMVELHSALLDLLEILRMLEEMVEGLFPTSSIFVQIVDPNPSIFEEIVEAAEEIVSLR